MDTSFFKSKEFRSLLERYEQMREYGMNSYFSSDDLLELASYYLFKNRAADAENVISYARKLYPGDTQITEAEILTLLSRGEVQEARRKLNAISVMDTPELQLLKAEVDMADGGDSAISRLNAIMEETNLRNDLALNPLDVMIKGGFLAQTAQEAAKCCCTAHSVAIRIFMGDDKNIVMAQKSLGALLKIHRPLPRRA